MCGGWCIFPFSATFSCSLSFFSGEDSGEDSSVKDYGADSVVYFPFKITFLCSLYFWRGFGGGFFCRAFWGGFCGEDSGVDSVVDVFFSLTFFLFSYLWRGFVLFSMNLPW